MSDSLSLESLTIDSNSSKKKNRRRIQGGWANFQYNSTARHHENSNPFVERSKAPVKGKNTICFIPNQIPPDIRIVPATFGLKTYDRPHSDRDVVVVTDLFGLNTDFSIYKKLLLELESNDLNGLWLSWHGDTHVIANDKLKWKQKCPTFDFIINRISEYFQMDVKATRLNWYRDLSEWKPFHHDAAAVKDDKFETQNITVAASFGAERDVAFEHATTRTVLSIPLVNGSVYSFGKNVNVLWRHGIPQKLKYDSVEECGRISVVAWGWHSQFQL